MFEIQADRESKSLFLREASASVFDTLESISARIETATDLVSPWDAMLCVKYGGYTKHFQEDLYRLLRGTNPRDPVNWCAGWSVVHNQFMEKMNWFDVLRALRKDYLLELHWRHTGVFHYTSADSAASILERGFMFKGESGESSFMDGLYFYKEKQPRITDMTLLHSIALGIPWFQCILGNNGDAQVGECIMPFEFESLKWEVSQ